MNTELRQALRFLWRRPAFSGAIVLTVAIAIAATTLTLAIVNGVLRLTAMRPNGIVEADRRAVQSYAAGENSYRSSIVKPLAGLAADPWGLCSIFFVSQPWSVMRTQKSIPPLEC